MNKIVEESREYKRNGRGRFVRGTTGGPGRPKKRPLNHDNVPLWSFGLLRDAWFTFRLAQKYDELGILRCRCGNNDLQSFDYQLTKGKFRARCQKCGSWNDFREKHAWFAEPLPSFLTKEERRLVRLQREGKI
ncbi:MAG: hypothetical protein QXF75_00125 [Candidatus Bathyarchaeia archaeon]